MTDTLHEHADPELHKGEPLIQMKDVGKTYGAIRALKGINLTVNAGEVTCVLGDNGAGKSTLIKILAGAHQQSEGSIRLNGEEVTFDSPREALAAGIATVYQDLAMVPLMSVWRNFFLGSEPTLRPAASLMQCSHIIDTSLPTESLKHLPLSLSLRPSSLCLIPLLHQPVK